jgi:hypothetical protein
MLQTSDITTWVIVAKNREKATLLTLLFDLIWD